MAAPAGESVILEEAIDENYEPTEDETLEYAKWLGMDEDGDEHLFWIAKEGLKAPLPEGWKPCKTQEGEIYYFNFSSGESVWDHPCDEFYRKTYDEEKTKPREQQQGYAEWLKKKEGGSKKESKRNRKAEAPSAFLDLPELERLKVEAVAVENYELAASLRNQIAGLQSSEAPTKQPEPGQKAARSVTSTLGPVRGGRGGRMNRLKATHMKRRNSSSVTTANQPAFIDAEMQQLERAENVLTRLKKHEPKPPPKIELIPSYSVLPNVGQQYQPPLPPQHVNQMAGGYQQHYLDPSQQQQQMSSVSRSVLTNDQYAICRRDFESFDTNKSGLLERKEIPKLLRKQLERKPTKSEIQSYMRENDINEDGKVSLVEYITSIFGEDWRIDGDMERNCMPAINNNSH